MSIKFRLVYKHIIVYRSMPNLQLVLLLLIVFMTTTNLFLYNHILQFFCAKYLLSYFSYFIILYNILIMHNDFLCVTSRT